MRGRDEVVRFLEGPVTRSLFDASTEVFRALDESRVVVEGRVRWIDDDRVIRDDPVIWAMEFRDELLYRSIAVRTMLEAEAVLAASD